MILGILVQVLAAVKLQAAAANTPITPAGMVTEMMSINVTGYPAFRKAEEKGLRLGCRLKSQK